MSHDTGYCDPFENSRHDSNPVVPFAPLALPCFHATMRQSDFHKRNACHLEFYFLNLHFRNPYDLKWISWVPQPTLNTCCALGPRWISNSGENPCSSVAFGHIIQPRHPRSLILTGLNSFTRVTACILPVYASRFSLPRPCKTRYKAPFDGLPWPDFHRLACWSFPAHMTTV